MENEQHYHWSCGCNHSHMPNTPLSSNCFFQLWKNVLTIGTTTARVLPLHSNPEDTVHKCSPRQLGSGSLLLRTLRDQGWELQQRSSDVEKYVKYFPPPPSHNPITMKQEERREEGFEYCNQTTLWEQGNSLAEQREQPDALEIPNPQHTWLTLKSPLILPHLLFQSP